MNKYSVFANILRKYMYKYAFCEYTLKMRSQTRG